MDQSMMKIPEGTVVIREGETCLDMYKIVHGSVEVYTGYGTEKEAILGILSKDDFFGEMGLLTGKPSLYTVVAYNEILVLRITEATIDSYLENNRRDAFLIMKKMAESMYNLKYGMDLFMNDVFEEHADMSEKYRRILANRVAKYSALGGAAGLRYDSRT
ncbi:MAG: cyclic nucleotide-binding domain-containing protein [Lachnospiraceae bacterium]|nr:cyclic nucleotide-binding domain-containing protein [Lachnospiraceae bacterium]